MEAISRAPKESLSRSRQKSLGYDEILLSTPINGATGTDIAEATRRLRRRRLSHGFAKGRERSPSRSRAPDDGAVGKCFNVARLWIRDYIWPSIAWLIALIPAILSLLACLAVLSIGLEYALNLSRDLACHANPSGLPSWTSRLPAPLQPLDPCAVAIQGPSKAILDDPTGVEALSAMDWPVEQIEQLEYAAAETRSHIADALEEAQNLHPTLQSAREVAALISEWAIVHEASENLLYNLLINERGFRTSVRCQLQTLQKSIKQSGIRSHDPVAIDVTAALISDFFSRTPAGKITYELARFAQDRASEAHELTGLVPAVIKALRSEEDIAGGLKVALPINVHEFVPDVDLEDLQQFLQHGVEAWTQSAQDIAYSFERQYKGLGNKYLDTSLALRTAGWSRNSRIALIDTVKSSIKDLVLSMAESEQVLAAAVEETKPLSMGGRVTRL